MTLISPHRSRAGLVDRNVRAMRGISAAATLSLACAAAFAQYSDGRIRIGVLDDMSGTFNDQTGVGTVIAARMAVADFGGSLRGNPIDVISGDHQNKSDIAANTARKWFDVDQVDMVVGLSNSSVAIAVQQIARDKGKVSAVTGAGSVALTGKECSPTGFHWVWDTYAVARGATVGNPDSNESWFFITADYAFGHALEADMSRGVTDGGGKIVGSVKAPMATPDYASFILQAKSSKAKVIGLATGGGDLINAIKQAREFGVVSGGQKLVSPLMFITDVHSLGLRTAAGLTSTTAFYWDLNEGTRAWSQRFYKERKAMPTMAQAGVYSAVMHFLKAADAAGTDDGKQVAQKMRELPVNDFMTKDGQVRADGRVLRDMYRVQVKQPAESKGPWDYYKVLSTIPAATAFRPLGAGGCTLASTKAA